MYICVHVCASITDSNKSVMATFTTSISIAQSLKQQYLKGQSPLKIKCAYFHIFNLDCSSHLDYFGVGFQVLEM